jgi:hypothetical protein
MFAPPPCSARRRGLAAGLALAAALLAVLASGRDARASTAATGQIVWSASNGIWAMDDNGADPHELISAASPSLAALLPSGTVSSPDVFQNDGTAVLFTGLTSAFAAPGLAAACGADCSATFELHDGALTELGPPAAPATGAAYDESQPRITADGQELFDSSLTTGILPASPGTPATALVERPLAKNAVATPWSDTDAEGEPAAGFDPAPDPAGATQAAWVQSQGCTYQYPNAQGVAQSSCQYAVRFGAASESSAPVVIYDNEFASDNGRGPTSLSLSTDGSTLLLVDPYAPNTGIYTTPVAGVPGLKPVTEVLAQPAGWTFGQARFAGSKIVFDAHQVSGSKPTGDIYTVPASCAVAGGCTFPASATDLTNDPSADNSDPAWTSATAPLQSLRVAALARITAASAPAEPVLSGRSFTLSVTLSAAATIVVRIARRAGTPPKYRTVGSLTAPGRRGTNHVSIRLVAGRALAAGSYTATVALRGAASTATRTLHFSVRA